jgi:hypothetical protein
METLNKTNNIELTEMWRDGHYLEVGETMTKEQWNPAQVAEFCSYFAKYIGLTELNKLHKFL